MPLTAAQLVDRRCAVPYCFTGNVSGYRNMGYNQILVECACYVEYGCMHEHARRERCAGRCPLHSHVHSVHSCTAVLLNFILKKYYQDRRIMYSISYYYYYYNSN